MAVAVEFNPSNPVSKPAKYVGISTDDKPTKCPDGSLFWAYDTNLIYKTHDGGTTWTLFITCG
jgi:hypothetical protein